MPYGFGGFGGGFGMAAAGLAPFTQLLTATEDFSNAAWLKSAGVTVTANSTVAPDGATTADTITGTATLSHNIRQSATVAEGMVLTASCYMKAGTSLKSRLLLTDGAWLPYVELTWTAGVPSITASGGGVSGATVTADAGGFYRISFQATVPASIVTASWQIHPDRNGTSKSVIAWGANLTVTPAVRAYKAG